MDKKIIYILIPIFLIITIGYGVMRTSKNQQELNLKREILTPQNLSPITQEEGEPETNSPEVEIDINNSIIKWEAKKTLVDTNDHFGTVRFKGGFVNMEEGTINGGKFVADMLSITDDDLTSILKKQLETHLKSDDFFATATYPTSEFIITKITPTGGTEFMIVGNLTIKGITNEINFPATVTNDETLLLKANFEIDRTLWDIRFGSGKFFDNLGNNLIDDIIKISIEITVPKS